MICCISSLFFGVFSFLLNSFLPNSLPLLLSGPFLLSSVSVRIYTAHSIRPSNFSVFLFNLHAHLFPVLHSCSNVVFLSSHFDSFHLYQVHTLGPRAAHLPPLALHPVTSQAPPTLSRPGRPRPPDLLPDPHPGPLGPCLTPLLTALQGPCPPCPNACPQKVSEIPDRAAILLLHHCSGSSFAIQMPEIRLPLTAVGLSWCLIK